MPVDDTFENMGTKWRNADTFDWSFAEYGDWIQISEFYEVRIKKIVDGEPVYVGVPPSYLYELEQGLVPDPRCKHSS